MRSNRNQAIKNSGGSWFGVAHNTTSGKNRRPVNGRNDPRDAERGIKNGSRLFPNDCADRKGINRKVASALIAKIPFELARHIAAVYKPMCGASGPMKDGLA